MKEGSSGNKTFGGSTEVRNDETGSQYLRNKNDRRKARKVVVERIRRERIERCLDQLKHILVQSVPQSQTGTNLEKADILELTVSHLEELRTSSPLHVSKGYLTCANEVDGFLQNVNCDPSVRHRMTQFLLKRQPTGSALRAMIGSTMAPNSSTEQIGDGHQLPANFFNPRSPPEQSARLKMCSGIESRSLATQSHSFVQSAAINKTSQVTCYDNRPTNVSIPFRPYHDADEIRGPIKHEPVWRPW